MADLCLQDRRMDLRLLYFGPEGAGCSTNLDQLSKGMADGRVATRSKDGQRDSLELNPLEIPCGDGLSLFVEVSVPVRSAEDPQIDEILSSVDGLVFVADAGRDRLRHNLLAWADLLEGMRRVERSLADVSVVFQVNKAREEHSMAARDVDTALNSEGHPSFEANAEVGKGVGKCFSEVVRRVVARASGELRLDPLGITRGALCGALDAALVEAGSRAARRVQEEREAAEGEAQTSASEDPVEPFQPPEADIPATAPEVIEEAAVQPQTADAGEVVGDSDPVDEGEVTDVAKVTVEPAAVDEDSTTDLELADEGRASFAVSPPQPQGMRKLGQGVDKSSRYLRRVLACIAERSEDPDVARLLKDSRAVLDYLDQVGKRLEEWSRSGEVVGR